MFKSLFHEKENIMTMYKIVINGIDPFFPFVCMFSLSFFHSQVLLRRFKPKCYLIELKLAITKDEPVFVLN